MSREEIEKAVLLIFEKNCGRKINILSQNVFFEEVGVTPRELAYVFLDIEHLFSIKINQLLNDTGTITVGDIIDRIQKIVG